ncbi:MAG: hypothetical protein AB1346_13035 [Thermodesulfobacteriota bacterium]
MKKICMFVAALMVVAVAGSGCKKKQPSPPPMPPQGAPEQPGMPGGMPPGGMPPGGMPGGMPGGAGVEKKVVIPDEVKKSWKAAKIEVEYKEKKEKKQFDMPLNAEFKVPDSGLTIKVGAFFPHFKMAPDQITSESNNPENPAVQVEVFEGGTEIFHGWLFAKFPEVHKFAHDKYAIALVGGVKK